MQCRTKGTWGGMDITFQQEFTTRYKSQAWVQGKRLARDFALHNTIKMIAEFEWAVVGIDPRDAAAWLVVIKGVGTARVDPTLTLPRRLHPPLHLYHSKKAQWEATQKKITTENKFYSYHMTKPKFAGKSLLKKSPFSTFSRLLKFTVINDYPQLHNRFLHSIAVTAFCTGINWCFNNVTTS